jgi:hypothetical protein
MADNTKVYAYTRTLAAEKVLILANLSGETVDANCNEFNLDNAETLLTNKSGARSWKGHRVQLAPWEACVLKLKA